MADLLPAQARGYAMGLEAFQTGSLAASREIGTALDMIRTVQNVVSQRIADKLAEERIKNAEVQRQALIQQIKRQQEAWQRQTEMLDRSIKAAREFSELITSSDLSDPKEVERLSRLAPKYAADAYLTEEGARIFENAYKAVGNSLGKVIKTTLDATFAANLAALVNAGVEPPRDLTGEIDKSWVMRMGAQLRMAMNVGLTEAEKTKVQYLQAKISNLYKQRQELVQLLVSAVGQPKENALAQIQAIDAQIQQAEAQVDQILEPKLKTAAIPEYHHPGLPPEDVAHEGFILQESGPAERKISGASPITRPSVRGEEVGSRGTSVLFDMVIPDPSDIATLPPSTKLSPDLRKDLEQYAAQTASTFRQIRDALEKQYCVVAQGKAPKGVYQENLLGYLYAYYAARLIRDAIAQGLVDDPVLYLNNATERINLVKSRGYELAKALAERGDPFWSRLFKEKTPVHERILKLLQGGNLVELPNIVTAK